MLQGEEKRKLCSKIDCHNLEFFRDVKQESTVIEFFIRSSFICIFLKALKVKDGYCYRKKKLNT